MKIKQKANLITIFLINNIPKHLCPLNHDDNYTLLIAVLLSAQCKDERVNEVTPHLFKLADDPLFHVKTFSKKIYKSLSLVV